MQKSITHWYPRQPVGCVAGYIGTKPFKRTGVSSELVFIKSEGDIDTVTPLYALGVQGIFTKTLDAALLSGRIDIAVHSMKDVPTQLAQGIQQAAVLKRASHKEFLFTKVSSQW